MLDIAEELYRWAGQGRDFAVATVVAVGGSAPRQPGAALAVDTDGTAIGSVSGGCVEGAVYELCLQALEDGETVLERFGYSDEDAFAVGLTCGGVIDILVTPVRVGGRAREVVTAALDAAVKGEAAALARIVSGPAELVGRALLVRPDGSYEGGLGAHPELDRTVVGEARAFLDAGRTGTLEIGEQGSRCGAPLTVLVESSVPPPRMIVFGAIDFASALVRIGKFLGYHVTVCDARLVFATMRPLPRRRRDRRGVAAPIPGTRPGRRADRPVRPHPRRQVRRTPAPPRAAPAGRVRRRDGIPADASGPQPAAARGRRHGAGARPPPVAHRPRPGRPHPRGDGPVHRLGDRGHGRGGSGVSSRGRTHRSTTTRRPFRAAGSGRSPDRAGDASGLGDGCHGHGGHGEGGHGDGAPGGRRGTGSRNSPSTARPNIHRPAHASGRSQIPGSPRTRRSSRHSTREPPSAAGRTSISAQPVTNVPCLTEAGTGPRPLPGAAATSRPPWGRRTPPAPPPSGRRTPCPRASAAG